MPQLSESVVGSVHTGPKGDGQITLGGLHGTHIEAWQAPLAQAAPHAPQWWGSLPRSVQVVTLVSARPPGVEPITGTVQGVCPSGHVHAPPEHLPPSHRAPHAPQLDVLVCVSVQETPGPNGHAASVAGHEQTPLSHVPKRQGLSQAPQSLVLVLRSLQPACPSFHAVPGQKVSPAPHWQAPLTHDPLGPQLVEQLPQ
jgi:hypothetical protein